MILSLPKKILINLPCGNDYLTAKDGKSAKCKKCGTVLKTLGGSTEGLNGGKEESTQDIEVTESRDVGKQHCD